MRIALLTGTALRHKYMAHQLSSAMDLALVIAEEKSQAITAVAGYTTEEATLLQKHFEGRAKTEETFFGNFSEFPEKAKCISVANGELHTDSVLTALKKYSIEAIALFGSSIVKEPILSLYPDKVINLHLGLSPYYRGSGTNFFPLLYGEPECMGATFHLATAEVDAGGILHQIRPETITKEDTIHTLGNTIIREAGQLFSTVLNGYLTGILKPKYPLTTENGKLFRVRDFTPEVLQTVQNNLHKHLENYLDNKVLRDRSKPILKAI